MGGKSSKEDDPALSKRKMSFTSAAMAFGAWPPATKMCEPTINATLFFDACPSVEGLVPLVETCRSYERCNGVPEGTEGKDDWRIRRVDFQPRDIIRTVKVDAAKDIVPAIEGLLHDSCRDRPGLPWWEIVRVEAPEGQQSAVVLRIDHIIGDGISLVNLMEQILTDTNNQKLDAIIPASMSNKFKRKLSFLQKIKMGFSAVYYYFFALTLGLGSGDAKTKFRRAISADMQYSWNRKLVIFETMPLAFIKELKKQGGVSLNDVMFSSLGGAIRAYNLAEGCEITEKKKTVMCRALMPVAFPRPNEDKSDKAAVLRNKWVFLSSDFGVGKADPMERIQYVNKSMTALKNSPYAFMQLKVQESAKSLPVSLSRKTLMDIMSRHSIIFSNVPGPETPVMFGGQKVTGTQMFFNNFLPQVGILSYCGNVHMNINIDTEAIPGSEMLPVYFARELVALAENLNVAVPDAIRAKANE
ncbi:hypothetical protein TeGR_g2303 [Tetraparma gracilis]|uniref:Diacylglycerol O-acyltransferase n=1 Tax=Tetraparma gracilis TaxID=2962635 RepID=A0ABQ6MB67_9STRA|nr:hypothetical protein TeGR_g2303 [Tetraparma gracilis]